jgi:hypothetical protein
MPSAFKSILPAHIFPELSEQTDRGAAIIGAAIVEHYLERALLSRMRPLSNGRYKELFDGKAPLATFSAKIEMGHALNIYGEKTRADLASVNWIRNRFAHNILGEDKWSFEVKEIKDRCDALELINALAVPIPSGSFDSELSEPRRKFVLSVFLLGSQLDGEVFANPVKLTDPMFLNL